MVEYVVVKSSIIDSLFISVYRPPGTNNIEWKQALTSLDREIKIAQSNGKYQRIFMGGDFNFPNLK